MFNKIKSVVPLENYQLKVTFVVGITKLYDVKKLIDKFSMFRDLEDQNLFKEVKVDNGGYGIIWNDKIDISCDELWENSQKIKTAFDGLMSFKDATTMWNLSESTLRKAISYGKLVVGVDVCKFGHQWVITTKAMQREYGIPKQ